MADFLARSPGCQFSRQIPTSQGCLPPGTMGPHGRGLCSLNTRNLGLLLSGCVWSQSPSVVKEARLHNPPLRLNTAHVRVSLPTLEESEEGCPPCSRSLCGPLYAQRARPYSLSLPQGLLPDSNRSSVQSHYRKYRGRAEVVAQLVAWLLSTKDSLHFILSIMCGGQPELFHGETLS